MMMIKTVNHCKAWDKNVWIGSASLKLETKLQCLTPRAPNLPTKFIGSFCVFYNLLVGSDTVMSSGKDLNLPLCGTTP
jgi:hypothetical protein